jgi:hypothetical protein
MNTTSTRNQAANVVYYLEVGIGDWIGTFAFRMSDWKAFRRDTISLRNRFLTLFMFTVGRLFRTSRITSHLEQRPDENGLRVVRNIVRISNLGLTVYLLDEDYILSLDGSHARVVSNERFGPVPFLFKDHKICSAEIRDSGMQAVYQIPLLGADWTGVYNVGQTHQHIESVITCQWAEARESINKVQPVNG